MSAVLPLYRLHFWLECGDRWGNQLACILDLASNDLPGAQNWKMAEMYCRRSVQKPTGHNHHAQNSPRMSVNTIVEDCRGQSWHYPRRPHHWPLQELVLVWQSFSLHFVLYCCDILTITFLTLLWVEYCCFHKLYLANSHWYHYFEPK